MAAGILALLLSVSFTRGQRARYPVLRKLDGKQLHLAAAFCLCLIASYGAQTLRELIELRVTFEEQKGPNAATVKIASDKAFDLEAKQASAKSLDAARSAFYEGRSALAAGLYQEAAEAFQSSTASLPTLAAELNLGIALRWSSRTREAVDVLRRGLSKARERRRDDYAAQFQFNLGSVLSLMRELDSSQSLLAEALKTFQRIEDDLGQANAHLNLGNIFAQRGQLDQAVHHWTAARGLYKSLDDPFGLAASSLNLGIAAANEEDWDKACAAFQDSLRGFMAIEHQANRARAHVNLSVCERSRGNLTAARAHALDAYELSIASSHLRGQADSAIELGRIAGIEGDLKAQREYAEEAESIGRANSLPLSEIHGLLLQADADLSEGKPESALERAIQAEVTASSFAYIDHRIPLIKAEASMALGDTDSAFSMFNRARDIADEHGTKFDKVQVQAHRAIALVELGRFEEAWPDLREATEFYREKGIEFDLAIELEKYSDMVAEKLDRAR